MSHAECAGQACDDQCLLHGKAASDARHEAEQLTEAERQQRLAVAGDAPWEGADPEADAARREQARQTSARRYQQAMRRGPLASIKVVDGKITVTHHARISEVAVAEAGYDPGADWIFESGQWVRA